MKLQHLKVPVAPESSSGCHSCKHALLELLKLWYKRSLTGSTVFRNVSGRSIHGIVLLLFHVGSNDTATRQLRTIKRDSMQLGAMLKGYEAQVVVFSILSE